jgi:hypothetical protein
MPPPAKVQRVLRCVLSPVRLRGRDVVKRKTLLRNAYQEIRLWPKTGAKPWTRKVLVAANLETLTRLFVVSASRQADATLMVRTYLLLATYAAVRFRALGT